MQVASVIGRDFAFRILQTITGMREELKSYLINLQGLEFIYEKNLFPELEYIFKHALTQEVAYNSLLLKRRKEIHESIGKAIEELYQDRLEEFCEMLAHHYSRSENSEKAYQYLRLSGEKAARSYSNWEAFRFYKEAINVLNQLPDSEENKRRGIEVRLLIAVPMTFLGYPEDSLQILQEGERLARELGDERSLARFYSSMGLYYSLSGDVIQGMKYAENCFREAEKIEDIELMAPIGFDLSSSYNTAGEFTKTAELAPKVIALLEKTQMEYESFGRGFNVYSSFLASYGMAVGWMGSFEEGEALCEKALRFALKIRDLFSLVLIEFIYGWIYNVKGDGENGVEHLQNAVRYAEEAQMFILLGSVTGGLGWGYYLLGNLETARKHVKRAFKINSEAGIPFALFVPYWVSGLIHMDSGDLENARSYMEESFKLGQNNNEKHVEGASGIYLGRILGKADISQGKKAEECILQGIKVLDEEKMKPWASQGYLCLGELYADMGQREKALENLKKAQGAFQEMGMDYYLRRTQEVLERVEAA